MMFPLRFNLPPFPFIPLFYLLLLYDYTYIYILLNITCWLYIILLVYFSGLAVWQLTIYRYR